LPDHDSRRVIDRISEQAGDRRVPGGPALPVRPRQDACQYSTLSLMALMLGVAGRRQSYARRRRAARRCQVLDPPGPGELVHVGGDAVDDRCHPREVDGDDGPVWPVG
jgi:hypothetical protein